MKLRLPEALRDRIKAAADANGRSMNAEIVGALSKAYPKSGTTLEKVAELFSLIQLNSNKIKQDDMAVIYELFDEIEADVGRLQRLYTSSPDDNDEEASRYIIAGIMKMAGEGNNPELPNHMRQLADDIRAIADRGINSDAPSSTPQLTGRRALDLDDKTAAEEQPTQPDKSRRLLDLEPTTSSTPTPKRSSRAR